MHLLKMSYEEVGHVPCNHYQKKKQKEQHSIVVKISVKYKALKKWSLHYLKAIHTIIVLHTKFR